MDKITAKCSCCGMRLFGKELPKGQKPFCKTCYDKIKSGKEAIEKYGSFSLNG